MSDLMLEKYSKLPEDLQKQVEEYIEFLILKYQGNFLAEPSGKRPSNFGNAKGLIIMQDGFDQPLDDFKDYR